MSGRTPGRPFLYFYAAALGLAAVIAPLRAALMPAVPPGVSPYQNLWDWMAEHDFYINLKNLLLYAIDGHPWAFLIFAFASAPTVAALIVCWGLRRGPGVAALVARLRPWLAPATRNRALRAYLVLVAAYVSGIAVYVVVGQRTGTPAELQQTWDALGSAAGTAAVILFLGVFLDEGGTLEELGWRGFALPLLQERHSPLVAAVLLGLLWWAWHFPREIPQLPANYDSLVYWGGQAQFLILVVLMSVVIAYFVNRTGGSVLPAIIIHGGSNVWGKALGMPVHAGFDLRIAILGIAALLIMIVAGQRLGLDPGERVSGPLDQRDGHGGRPTSD
jgi:membrane protease YdiL (CAAX protease family)